MMMLVKKNEKKGREVYKINNLYLKKYYLKDERWLKSHVNKLTKVVPDYLLDYGVEPEYVWIKVKELSGKPAGEFDRTDEFVKLIVEFCQNNYRETYPYAHGDWAISNILIDGDKIHMCDWDGLSIYPEEWVYQKMYNSLLKPFGHRIDDYMKQSGISSVW